MISVKDDISTETLPEGWGHVYVGDGGSVG